MRSLAMSLCLCAALFLTGCSGLFYHPDRNLYLPPDKLGLEYREFAFPSRDGTELWGWLITTKRKNPKGTLVQFHGNAENMSSHFISLAWLVDLGYDVFTFDYRGYGRSSGEPSQEGTYNDALAALSKAWELRRGTRFVIIGQSLGGAIAMRGLADFAHKDEVDLMVMDSTFVSYKDVARRKMASVWFLWPFSPLGIVLISDKYSAEEANKQSKVRLLVIHDEKDPGVPFGAGEELFEESGAQKEFWKLSDGRHIGVFAKDRPRNRERFLKLIDSLN